jgi:putative oxidoreductase
MKMYAPLIGRILVGLLFLIAGIEKFLNVQGTAQYITSAGLPFPSYLAQAAGSLEILCGALLILGFKTRYAAGVLAVYTIAVNGIFHTEVMGAQQMAFLKDMAIAGGLLYIATYGSQVYSLDGRK